MDRSRRATNPQNYNDNGTIKKGKKTWNYSNHYKKLKAKHAELCRINATNRRLAINEDVNHLRSIGDVFITEPKNAAKLMKRASKTTVNDKGKINKKKRFGRSIKNRCSDGFQAAVENRFKTSGGTYIEVPNNYRASQYDHTADDYIKKKLSDRMYKLTDGTLVQRDMLFLSKIPASTFLKNVIPSKKMRMKVSVGAAGVILHLILLLLYANNYTGNISLAVLNLIYMILYGGCMKIMV